MYKGDWWVEWYWLWLYTYTEITLWWLRKVCYKPKLCLFCILYKIRNKMRTFWRCWCLIIFYVFYDGWVRTDPKEVICCIPTLLRNWGGSVLLSKWQYSGNYQRLLLVVFVRSIFLCKPLTYTVMWTELSNATFFIIRLEKKTRMYRYFSLIFPLEQLQ